MADPAQTPPATPPADPATGGNNPAATPAPQQGIQQQPPAPIIMSQEQFDKRWAEEKGKLEKELGLQPGGLKDFIEKSKKPQAPIPSSDPLSGAELRLAKMEALMLAKVPSERIPGLLSRVQGKSKAEIEADIQQMITDGFLKIEATVAQPQQQGPPNAAQGAGNPGVPGTPQKKTFTLAEVREKSKDPAWYEANRDAIQEAMAKGEIK